MMIYPTGNHPTPIMHFNADVKVFCVFAFVISEHSSVHEYTMLKKTTEIPSPFPQLSMQPHLRGEVPTPSLPSYTAKDSLAPHSSASLSTDSLILLYALPEKHLRACTPLQVFLLKAIINHLPFVSRLSAYFANAFSLFHPGFRVERGLP